MSSAPSTFKADTMSSYVESKYGSVNKNRMHATILQNMSTDVWMTFELMEASIKQMTSCADFPVKGLRIEQTIRDLGSAKVASKLGLKDSDADNFFCFHGIKLDDDSHETFKHGNRPDGTFKLTFKDSSESEQKMVLFYEGDNHGKDSGKDSLTDGGCRNAHKFYQYFAQSQAYNSNLAACVIIAAIGRATAGFVPFVNSMFQAHMLAFSVIAHYNYERDDKKKKETFLGKHLKLKEGVNYDFVIGINMAANSSSAWRSGFWDERMQEINKLTPAKVEIAAAMKDVVAGTLTFDFTIKNVSMVFIAIPRAEKDYLKDATTTTPCFLYPMHLAALISDFHGRNASVQPTAFSKVLDIRMGNPTIKFRKEMMDLTILLTKPNTRKNKQNVRQYCQLSECDGFFLAALPVAYYTIQQLELVNDILDYNYKRGAKPFTKVADAYKDVAFQTSTRKISVSILSKDDKRVSLFQEICNSVSESQDKIEEDLKSFLEEGCLWDTTDCNSPVVFFLSMRIFSLQSAMDFAFDIQSGQNEVYSKMLLSYPIGTQIIIKQCMKKLTENGAPGYFLHDIDEDEQDLKDISDDEEEDANYMGRLLQSVSSTHKTMWKFGFKDIPLSIDKDAQDLAALLLAQYKEETKWKKDDDAAPNNTTPDDIKEKIRTESLKGGGIFELKLNLKEFNPDTVYTVDKLSYTPDLPKDNSTEDFVANGDVIFQKVKDKTDLAVAIQWGSKVAQFEFVNQNSVMKLIVNWKNKAKTFWNQLL